MYALFLTKEKFIDEIDKVDEKESQFNVISREQYQDLVDKVLMCCIVATSLATNEPRAKKKDDNRGKRNLDYDISHHQSSPNYRIERRISSGPQLQIPQNPYLPLFFPVQKPYISLRRGRLPPYAVPMEPLVQYSQRDPLYDPNTLTFVGDGTNDIKNRGDFSQEHSHGAGNIYGKVIERPVYIKEPEPIIEIIIRESNITLPPLPTPIVTPAPRKKEQVHVFYVKYKKNPHSPDKDSIIYDKPVPAIAPHIPDEEPLQVEPPIINYEAPVTGPPPPSTTLRAIVKPESEVFHADKGIHITFGKQENEQYKRSNGQDVAKEESAPEPALTQPRPQGRQFSSFGQRPPAPPNNNFNFESHRFAQANRPPPPPQFTKQLLPNQRPPINFNYQSFPPKTGLPNLNLASLNGNPSVTPRQPVPYKPFPSFSRTPVHFPTHQQLPQVNQQQQFHVPHEHTHLQATQQQFQNNVRQEDIVRGQIHPQRPPPNNFQVIQQQQSHNIANGPQYPINQIQQNIQAGGELIQSIPKFEQHISVPINSGKNQIQTAPQNLPPFNSHEFTRQVHEQSKQQLPVQTFDHSTNNQQATSQLNQNIAGFFNQKEHAGGPITQGNQNYIKEHSQPQFTHESQQNFAINGNEYLKSNNQHQITHDERILSKQQPIQSNENLKINVGQYQQAVAGNNQFGSHANVAQVVSQQHGNQNSGSILHSQYQQNSNGNRPQELPNSGLVFHGNQNSGLNQNQFQQNFLETDVRTHNQDSEGSGPLQQSNQHLAIDQNDQYRQSISDNQLRLNNYAIKSNSPSQQSNQDIVINHNEQYQQNFGRSTQSYKQEIATNKPLQQIQYQQYPLTNLPQQIQYRQNFATTKSPVKHQQNSFYQTTSLPYIQPSSTYRSTSSPAQISKPSQGTEIKVNDADIKALNSQLPDEVPPELREQLLSSGILKDAQISVLDYDKVGDIPLSALPPDQLANFFGAGGGQQIGSGSENIPVVVDTNGKAVTNSDLEMEGSESEPTKMRAPVEMKVVRYDPSTEQGREIQKSYIKEGATQVETVALDGPQYNQYLPLKVNGAAFPIPNVPELKGRVISSVVVLAPVELNDKQRLTRDISNKSSRALAKQALKALLANPTTDNFNKWLEKENGTTLETQAVVLLVTAETKNTTGEKEIFMYDIRTKTVSKLSGELSSAFVDAAELNVKQNIETIVGSPSNIVETKVPLQDKNTDKKNLNPDLQSGNVDYEERFAEASEPLESYADVSGMPTELQGDLNFAASETKDDGYFRYLPVKIDGSAFPFVNMPELKGINLNSTVILVPVGSQSNSIKALKTLLQSPNKETYKNWLSSESQTVIDNQAVVLLVSREKEIYMYDISTRAVNKLSGELSSAFVDAAETNSKQNIDFIAKASEKDFQGSVPQDVNPVNSSYNKTAI